MQDKPPALMSLSAFAKRHGVSHVAVWKAVKVGRLSASVQLDAKGKSKIADVDLADQEWRDNADHSKAPGYIKEGARDDSKGGRPAAGAAPSALSMASTREKQARASLAEMELARKAGDLVRAVDVEAEWTDMLSHVLTAMLAIPAHLKALCPDLTHKQLAAIEEAIKRALELLATPVKKVAS